MSNQPKFADIVFKFQEKLQEFEQELLEKGEEKFDFSHLDFNNYDSSIEFFGVTFEGKLSEEQQKLIIQEGFQRVFLNHSDGSETYYKFNDFDPQPIQGVSTKIKE